MKFLWLETQLKLDNLNVRLLPLDKRNTFEMLFHLVSSLLNTCERSWALLSPIVKKDCFNWAVFNANYNNNESVQKKICRKFLVPPYFRIIFGVICLDIAEKNFLLPYHPK